MSGKRRTTRRQFLKGESARGALEDLTYGPELPSGQAAGQADRGAAPGVAERPAGAYLLEFTRTAMACKFAVLFNAGQYRDAAERAFESLDLVEQLEDQMTVYREHSEICQLNRTAAESPMVMDSGLYELLKQARLLHAETGGAFDITSGPLTKVWGFYRKQGQLPERSELDAALSRVGSQHLLFDDAMGAIAFDRSGIEVNLGAIGKGYALDCAANLLAAAEIRDFAIHGGQSSIIARGSRIHAGEPSEGWQIGVNHPLRPEVRVAEFTLRNQALGTSGSRRQSFYHQGKRYGHIIDPRDGQPVSGVHSVTVVADSAAVADALSTAFYVMGVETSLEYCRRHPEIGAMILTPATRSGSVDVHTVGLTESTCRVLSEK